MNPELFPRTEQELIMWKLEYADCIHEWKRLVHVEKNWDPADYIDSRATVTKWLIELDRAVPGAVVYKPACIVKEPALYLEDQAFESMTVYVAGVYVDLMTAYYYHEVQKHAHKLANGNDSILLTIPYY